MVIKHHGKNDGMPQVQLSKYLILTPSNMTKLIAKLEKEGLVERSALKGDRRVNITRITKKGSDLLDRVWETYNEQLLVLTAQLTKNDQEILSKILIAWLKEMRGGSA